MTSQEVLITSRSLHPSIKNLFLTCCVFEPETATQAEARSNAVLEVEKGEGMPGLITGNDETSERDPSDLPVHVCYYLYFKTAYLVVLSISQNCFYGNRQVR